MTFRPSAALAAVFVLAACGGGGGSGSGPSAPTSSISLTRDTAPPTAAEVLDYLAVFASGGPWYSGNNREYRWQADPGLFRFPESPTVRIAEGTDDHQRAMILHAVAMVNRALPYESHIKIGTDAPALALIGDVPDGQIFVDFALHDDWKPAPRPDFLPTGQAQSQDRFVTKGGEQTRQRRAAHIWLQDSPRLSPARRIAMSTMVHELLHALGINGHVDPDKYPASFLRETLPPKETRLGPLDIAAIQALYTRLDVATQPEDLTLGNLGPWEAETVSLSGSLGPLSFGVRHRNGISVPWTNGVDPQWDEKAFAPTTLADNRALRGSAIWAGQLVGFTSDQDAVRSKAEIGITLTTMTGRADFTEMQSWPAGEQPGALGTGTTWKTGSLGYTITVGGNFIRSTGGDAGVLHGRFYGHDHRGVAGSVERDDLTAAFGGTRR